MKGPETSACHVGGSAPKPPGFIAFLGPEWATTPGAFRRPPDAFPAAEPVARLLPSIALSHPVQVRSVCKEEALQDHQKLQQNSNLSNSNLSHEAVHPIPVGMSEARR
jgi:hypothetical protein